LKKEAADEVVLERLREADIVMFGGDQLRLTSILGGTPSRYFYWINTIMKSLFMRELQQQQHQTV
jgi:cyanophycinase-like exopeptidase